jgi:hypothetical protein
MNMKWRGSDGNETHAIAAAPDLLAACHIAELDLAGICAQYGIPADNRTIRLLRAAIAKARGE